MINKIKHWLAHLFGWNYGKVISWRDETYVYVGFKCDYCEKIDKNITEIIKL